VPKRTTAPSAAKKSPAFTGVKNLSGTVWLRLIKPKHINTRLEMSLSASSGMRSPSCVPTKMPPRLINTIPSTVPARTAAGKAALDARAMAVSWVLSPSSPRKKARATTKTGFPSAF